MTAKNWQRKNAKIYAPEYLGISDVLIGGGVGKVMSMYCEMRDAVLTEGIALENDYSVALKAPVRETGNQ